MARSADTLRAVRSINDLIRYLEAELDWPLQEYGLDELTFEYQPAELGLHEKDAAKIRHIYQLRPLEHGQPWGIFFVEFEQKKLPVVVLRRILSHLVVKQRASANTAERARWQPEDLLFISAYGAESTAQREIAFAHFHQTDNDLPTLRVLGWDGNDTPLKLEHVAATLKDRLRWPDDPSDHAAWRQQWRGPFRHRIGHIISTTDKLAEALAALARSICARCLTMLTAETEQGPLRQLYKAFQTALIHDLKETDFADTYAQTITYGLLTAAFSRTEMSEGRHGTALVAEDLTGMVPITNPFLSEMLQTFLKVGGRKGGIDFDELGIQDVVELLRGDETDLPEIRRDFNNRTPGEDPVIRFYEDFLAAYNKKLKVQRGVFYTPQPAVSYIVRSVHELLQTEFGLEDGLASTITWGEMIERHPNIKLPQGTDPTSPFVVILDPATGTATFLVEVIDVLYKTMTNKWKREGRRDSEIQQMWNDYVPHHLLPRLYGYELMMAPYAIAHMKIGLKLFETGYRFNSQERVRVYLTNALEPAHDVQPSLPTLFPALAREAYAVNTVKRNCSYTIIIGNPPYSVTSANFNLYIDSLMNSYKKHVRGEQGLVALADDYLKFIRLSQELIYTSGCGLWGMITNHGYLKGIIHRGVRKELVSQFEKVFVLDLHGDSNIGEISPVGQANENVFDIQQGVAIAIGIQTGKSNLSAKFVQHAHSWGTQSEKYYDLNQYSIFQRNWKRLVPNDPNFFLIPFNVENIDEYQTFLSISDIMPTNSCGVKTHRDGLVIDFEKITLIERMKEIASQNNLQVLRERFAIKDTPHWKLADAKMKLNASEVPGFIFPLTYRPFDYRWIYYNPAIIEKGDSKYPTLRHMLRRNLALITARIQATGIFDAIFISQFLVEMKTGESSRSCTVFPLLLLAPGKPGQQEFNFDYTTPNFSLNFLQALSRKLNTKQSGQFALPDGISPEEIFCYIYTILHSPTYRARYNEFLKIDFPRIPLTSRLDLFRTLATLGGELVALHLVESPLLTGITVSYEPTLQAWRYTYGQPTSLQLNFNSSEKPVVEKVSWSNDTVWLDKAQSIGFHGVPEAVWNFHVGGYQVCEKWLKDRKGRTLSADDLAHYHRIVVALHETIRLMGEIDEAINAHGGWPIQ
jgi:hypothetical protein